MAYYVCGLPTAALLAFRLHLDVIGLVCGMIVGTAIQAVWYSTMVLRLDWEKQAEEAAARVKRQAADLAAAQRLRSSSSNLGSSVGQSGRNESLLEEQLGQNGVSSDDKSGQAGDNGVWDHEVGSPTEAAHLLSGERSDAVRIPKFERPSVSLDLPRASLG